MSTRFIECPNCGQKNKFLSSPVSAVARCQHCGRRLNLPLPRIPLLAIGLTGTFVLLLFACSAPSPPMTPSSVPPATVLSATDAAAAEQAQKIAARKQREN